MLLTAKVQTCLLKGSAPAWPVRPSRGTEQSSETQDLTHLLQDNIVSDHSNPSGIKLGEITYKSPDTSQNTWKETLKISYIRKAPSKLFLELMSALSYHYVDLTPSKMLAGGMLTC